jgi:hypothetical protein
MTMDNNQIKRDFQEWAAGADVGPEISNRLTQAVRWIAWLGWMGAAEKYLTGYGKPQDVQGQAKLFEEQE